MVRLNKRTIARLECITDFAGRQKQMTREKRMVVPEEFEQQTSVPFPFRKKPSNIFQQLPPQNSGFLCSGLRLSWPNAGMVNISWEQRFTCTSKCFNSFVWNWRWKRNLKSNHQSECLTRAIRLWPGWLGAQWYQPVASACPENRSPCTWEDRSFPGSAKTNTRFQYSPC